MGLCRHRHPGVEELGYQHGAALVEQDVRGVSGARTGTGQRVLGSLEIVGGAEQKVEENVVWLGRDSR